MRMLIRQIGFLGLLAVFAGCHSEKKADTVFRVLDPETTGLTFQNRLSYSPEFNLFKYMYFYNGSGIGAADFNGDGKIDLFFASNQQQNQLFLNEGNLRFRDVTAAAGIPHDGGWSTGVSVVDINQDGLLDIYVCRVGQYETLHAKNQLLINEGVDKNGVPQFTDKAAAYGLDFSGFSTQAAFFDYDNDGDLDMFLLNHSVHQNNNFRPRGAFTGTTDPLSGDRIYRNDNGRFTDVTATTGINSTSIGYGLGICVADINLDGYPDIYIGNDFHENDYLYINQKNGTFRDESAQWLMHTSQYSMGVDVADMNNDALPEIVSLDMLPSDPYILKRSLGEDNYDLFREKTSMGYSYQFTRNNLQLNRGNGLFSEIGLFSGMAATDWSWAPLWMDFDNDGWKDLFISNGIPKRMNDIDYVNFISNGEIQQKVTGNDIRKKDLSLISKFPEIKIPNRFFKNNGSLVFTDMDEQVEGNAPTFSNGAVYADLDNDGDLDIVVSNIDSPALIYENRSANNGRAAFADLMLQGPPSNRFALGAKLLLYSGSQLRTYENFPVKGFLSSMQVPLHVGLENTKVDSAFLIWPDRTFQPVTVRSQKNNQTIVWKAGLPEFDFDRLAQKKLTEKGVWKDITAIAGINFRHRENRFVEFDREPLIPHMVSTEGPAAAVADINGDKREDIFLGGARDQPAAIFLQLPNGSFEKMQQPALQADSSYEDTDACWTDVNGDGIPDLVVASGGNEFYGEDVHNTPRVYLNEGKGKLQRVQKPFGDIYLTASIVVATDLDGDGFEDLFIGGRTVPWGYGQIPRSYLFKNNRNGTFTDVTAQYAKELLQPGMVTNAQWVDLDDDGDMDLLLTLEWDGIVAFINEGGRFSKKYITEKKGWWNFLLPIDVNGDGKLDFIAGNLGLNSRLKASDQQPVKMYYNDFDGNGRKEQVLTYYLDGREIPFATKAELEKQMPFLKKKFLYAGDLAKASLTEIFGAEKLKDATKFSASFFANALIINKGNGSFETTSLPAEAQFSTLRAAAIVDANGDGKPDVLLGGNYYESNLEMGRYDADFGTLLLNQGNGKFVCQTPEGFSIKSAVRHILPLRVGNSQAFLLACNNDSARVLQVVPKTLVARHITGQ